MDSCINVFDSWCIQCHTLTASKAMDTTKFIKLRQKAVVQVRDGSECSAHPAVVLATPMEYEPALLNHGPTLFCSWLGKISKYDFYLEDYILLTIPVELTTPLRPLINHFHPTLRMRRLVLTSSPPGSFLHPLRGVITPNFRTTPSGIPLLIPPPPNSSQ